MISELLPLSSATLHCFALRCVALPLLVPNALYYTALHYCCCVTATATAVCSGALQTVAL
jgi:hypothetical protein